jgi:hypothetical protein
MVHPMSGTFIQLSGFIAGLAIVLGGCFESGPLGATNSGLGPSDDDAATDLADSTLDDAMADGMPPDTEASDTGSDTVPPDTVIISDTSDVSDTTPDTTPDTTNDTAQDTADTATDTAPLRSCLTNDDCVGLSSDDLCGGPIRCVDYGCRPDPTQVVTCSNGGDPCLEASCDPATGACQTRSLCSCDSPLALACDTQSTWSTTDPGTRPAFDTLGSCPASTGAPVRVLRFTGVGRTRLEAGAGVSRFWVLDADSCQGDSCLVGAQTQAFFNAVAGVDYAIAVEETGAATASLRSTCNLIREDRCSNGVDEDGDGQTDCDDRDCDNIDGCVRPPDNEVGLCDNGIDDDSDGKTDCADLDCDSDPACLQACEVPTGFSYCNFSQGLGTGGGKSRSSHYSCNPVPQTSKEVVYKFQPTFSGTVRLGFQTSAGLTLHLLRETGRGCTPRDCIGMATGDLWFEAEAGTRYYAVIDGPGAVTGSFDIAFDCDPLAE